LDDLIKSAKEGSAGAQYQLGLCYYGSVGVGQDFRQAVEWYAKIAQQGNADAQFRLGGCYYGGVGAEKDHKQAVNWFFKAAEQGHVSAKGQLQVLQPERTEVFVSFAEKDEKYVEQMEQYLKALNQNHGIPIWHFKKLTAGKNWETEIFAHMRVAKVAVLMVSQSFLNSLFIREKELPELLQAAVEKKLTILWIPVTDSEVNYTKIKCTDSDGKAIGVCITDYQAVCNPKKPLQNMNNGKRNAVYSKLCNEIRACFSSEVPKHSELVGAGCVKGIIAKARPHKKKIIGLVAVALISIAIVVGVVLYNQGDKGNEPAIPSLSIISPVNGTKVTIEQMITGNSSSTVPENSAIWIVLCVNGSYYPQSEIKADETGHWTYTAQFDWMEPGAGFDIWAIIANETARKTLAKESELENLPAGAEKHDLVHVDRTVVDKEDDKQSKGSTPPPPPTSTPSPTTSPPTSGPVPTPSPTQTLINIITPANNAPANMYEWVSGTSQNIPAGQHLWIIVQVDGLYFAHEVLSIDANGRWAHDTQIGQDDEGGKRFEVMAVLVDSKVHDALCIWRDKQNTVQPDDLKNLPVGIEIYDTVTVTRRNAAENTSVAIISPVNNASVTMIEWVSGTSQNIPAGQQLWVIVHEGNLYFPMVNRVQINTDGTWRYSATIGKEDDQGKSFEIMAVLANSSAQTKIQEWYKNPYDLQNLPSGITLYSTITVTRL
jgi:hypothetical protein